MVVTEEIKNLRRLEAQRNELNAKGWCTFHYSIALVWCLWPVQATASFCVCFLLVDHQTATILIIALLEEAMFLCTL